MKIAIIGAGISGLTCAHHLYKHHQITLFEANDYVGGHTATVDVTTSAGEYAIDTGFIVFNNRTYPHFQALLAEIGVQYQPTQMSFSVKNTQNNLEYNGHNISSLFAQKTNLVNPKFYRLIFEMLRFNQKAKAAYKNENLSAKTLGAFLKQHRFSDYFCQNYILPMGAAIWSSTLADMRCFPLRFFLQFFLNHGLLEVTNRPQWYVIKGGSREYVKKLIKPFASHIHLLCPVSKVERDTNGVTLVVKDKKMRFDQVIFACHSDQALNMIDKPTFDEIAILGDIKYQNNEVILHTDVSLLPKNQKAWASWNYHLDKKDSQERDSTTLTYNMNILQSIDTKEIYCVSLNQSSQINKSKILRRFTYAHPIFSITSIEAQKKRDLILGKNHSWFCGAYWYNGFHEDGVRSALELVEQLKKQVNKTKTEVAYGSN